MARSPIPEIFPKVKLIFNPKTFAEPTKTIQELENKMHVHNKGSHVEVTGSFRRIEETFLSLSTLQKKNPSDAGHKQRDRVNEPIFSPAIKPSLVPPAEPVVVDAAVMRFIRQKHPKESDQMTQMGVDLWTDGRPVTFRPGDQKLGTAQAQFARERFITFYQKIATRLQTRPYNLSSSQMSQLHTQFPELLMTHNKHELTVTGSFLDLERFERFVLSPPKRSSPKQINHMDNARPTASSPPAGQDQQTGKEEVCCICLETLVKSKSETLAKCKHSFCRDCLKRAFEIKPVCPTCGTLYGALKGTQPEGGRMQSTRDSSSLPGYEGYGTIVIHYYVPSGIQEEEHPNPGRPYEGASRTAYLPDSSEGKKVLKLLKQAFEQRLIFTIGSSSTTGRSNVVTWNDIHHKTSRFGGATAYGYPDPDYLNRVQDELKAKGIH